MINLSAAIGATRGDYGSSLGGKYNRYVLQGQSGKAGVGMNLYVSSVWQKNPSFRVLIILCTGDIVCEEIPDGDPSGTRL